MNIYYIKSTGQASHHHIGAKHFCLIGRLMPHSHAFFLFPKFHMLHAVLCLFCHCICENLNIMQYRGTEASAAVNGEVARQAGWRGSHMLTGRVIPTSGPYTLPLTILVSDTQRPKHTQQFYPCVLCCKAKTAGLGPVDSVAEPSHPIVCRRHHSSAVPLTGFLELCDTECTYLPTCGLSNS